MGPSDSMQMAPVVKEIIRMKNCVLYPPPPSKYFTAEFDLNVYIDAKFKKYIKQCE